MNKRYIGENVRILIDSIEYAEENDIPCVIIGVDFEKAFDSVDWNFMFKTLDYFNFGPSFKKWMKCFYNNRMTCILNNGWTTKLFELKRGFFQGCPLSPYLFLLCAEIFASAIRMEKEIKGIFVDGNEIKLSLYADDTNVITIISNNIPDILSLISAESY